MKKLWTAIGVIGGWAVGGILGGILGGVAAEILTGGDSTKQKAGKSFRTGGRTSADNTQPGDFHISLLVLSAIVIKADGVVDKRELDYVRQRFVQMFGVEKANESFILFKHIVKQNIKITEVCEQIRRNMAHSGRLQLVYFLFEVAGADGKTDASEIDVIRKIARYLNVREMDFESIHATFVGTNTLSSAYTILEIEDSATDEEVKKAYRKMAVKYHPDKLQHLGEDVQKAAQDKFVKVQEAYDKIMTSRKK